VKNLRKDAILRAGPCQFKEHAEIRIIGSKVDVEKAELLIKAIPNLETLDESKVRLIIQDIIETHNLKAHILVDGNSVWNSIPIITNLKRIMEHGKLYEGRHPGYVQVGEMLRFPVADKCVLSDYFYDFLNLHCGSIAHYNKQGWVTVYPTVEDLKEFFKKNEYGRRVLDDLPDWFTDGRRIVEKIEFTLFPLQSYAKAKAKVKVPA
jgi:hypothetical protein